METTTAATTESIYFTANMNGFTGRRLAAGTEVQVRENRHGKLIAWVKDNETMGLRYEREVTMSQLQGI